MGQISVDQYCVFSWPKLAFNPLANYTVDSKQQSLKDTVFRFGIIVATMGTLILITILAAVYMKCAIKQQQKKQDIENSKQSKRIEE